jgi:tetratricopeptide (TPR) repeat protein
MKKIHLTLLFAFILSTAHAQLNMSVVQPFLDQGKSYLQSGNKKEAIVAFYKAIKASAAKPYREGHPDVYVMIGDIYMSLSAQNICHLYEANNNYTRARDIEPKHKISLERLADKRFEALKEEAIIYNECNK